MSQDIKNEISVPTAVSELSSYLSVGDHLLVASFFGAENIVDIKDIIAVLVVEAIVLDALARLGQYSAGIARRLVLEGGVADAIGGWEMDSESLQGLQSRQVSTRVIAIAGEEALR